MADFRNLVWGWGWWLLGTLLIHEEPRKNTSRIALNNAMYFIQNKLAGSNNQSSDQRCSVKKGMQRY